GCPGRGSRAPEEAGRDPPPARAGRTRGGARRAAPAPVAAGPAAPVRACPGQPGFARPGRHQRGPARQVFGGDPAGGDQPVDPAGDRAAGPALPCADPPAARRRGDRREGAAGLPLRRGRPALARDGGPACAAAAVPGLRIGVPAHPDPQLRGPRPLISHRRPGGNFHESPRSSRAVPTATRVPGATARPAGAPAPTAGEAFTRFSFMIGNMFTSSLVSLPILRMPVPLPMKPSLRWFFLLACLLVPGLAVAQQQGLEIDIIGGNASALPIAVVPMPYEGGGAAPETDVAKVVRDDLARSGQFRTLPVEQMVERPTRGGEIQYPTWRQLRQDYLVVGRVLDAGEGGYRVEYELFDVARG